MEKHSKTKLGAFLLLVAFLLPIYPGIENYRSRQARMAELGPEHMAQMEDTDFLGEWELEFGMSIGLAFIIGAIGVVLLYGGRVANTDS